jgi:hypothetical protein
MGKRIAVLIAACATLAAVAATSADAKVKVVKAKFQASYTFSGTSGSTWDLPADQFCPGVRWAENARAVSTNTYRAFKLSLESNAHATSLGANLTDGEWSASGNYFPDNDCGAQPQKSTCSGVVAFDHPDTVTPLLLVVVKKGTVLFSTGGAGMFEKQEGGGCLDGQVLAGPAFTFQDNTVNYTQVMGKVSLGTLAKKTKLTIDMKPTADTPKGWSVDDCQHLNGACKGFVDVTRSRLTLKRL